MEGALSGEGADAKRDLYVMPRALTTWPTVTLEASTLVHDASSFIDISSHIRHTRVRRNVVEWGLPLTSPESSSLPFQSLNFCEPDNLTPDLAR
jgi:hypothetical protein